MDESNKRIPLINLLFSLYFLSIIMIIFSDIVSANTAPIIARYNANDAIAFTFLFNLPLNFILFSILFILSHLINSNCVYKHNENMFIIIAILTIFILTFIGALIDYYVLTAMESKTEQNEFIYDPSIISAGLVLIWLSFFCSTWLILKQKIFTSIMISTGITVLNFISWPIWIEWGVELFDYIICFITLLIIFIIDIVLFRKWYKKRYDHFHK